ncbi:hypothetical protein EST38_g7891 [Candolleomyces aberdarensis]|uniref:Uncharacterized protein n=1 Tax=Candolleomyces aberdarensis TaxID=2316362 RepID=A0A4Q2DG74_9AGAR|nr:hypothetical protein EST38_g7891 [Candolleomyces aberdarensis]
MGRKILYFTEDEKKAAKRARDKRPQDYHQSILQPIPFWKRELERLEARLERYMKGMSAYDYVGAIVRRYRVNCDAAQLESAQATFGSLVSDIRRLAADVIQSHGCGEEMKRVKALDLQVLSLIRSLDDIECYVLLGELEEAYTQGRLIYLKL